MAAEVQALLGEGCIPAVSGADAAGVVKKALGFFDPGELTDLQLSLAIA
jgi:hypothetical protein